MDELTINAALVAILVPLVVGIVQVAKGSGLPARWAGVAALGVGMALGVAVALYTGDWFAALAAGLVAGLSGAGAYSGTKAATR